MNYGMNPNMYYNNNMGMGMNMGMGNSYVNQIPNYQNQNNNNNLINYNDIITVNGREGAERLELRPNSRILLLDKNKPIVWLKQTDGAGYGTVEGYAITPLKEAEPKDMSYSDLEARINNIEKRLEGLYEQRQSNSGSAKSASGSNSK